MGDSGPQRSSWSSDGGSSSRPRELTRTELEVIAALAMNANHERSIRHSANLDSDLLDHHAHPLHSVPASLSDDRFGSLVPPAAVHPASELSFGSPRDRASNLSLSSDEEHLMLHRQELARECDHARDTISRLGTFLERSERMLAALDERIVRANEHASKSSNDKEYTHSPLKQQSEPYIAFDHNITPLIHSSTVTTASASESTTPERSEQRQLDAILSAFRPCEAKPSQLLQKRKLVHMAESKESRQAGDIGLSDKRPRKLLWEICPSANPGVIVVSTKDNVVAQ
jgi:hypothetical protein